MKNTTLNPEGSIIKLKFKELEIFLWKKKTLLAVLGFEPRNRNCLRGHLSITYRF